MGVLKSFLVRGCQSPICGDACFFVLFFFVTNQGAGSVVGEWRTRNSEQPIQGSRIKSIIITITHTRLVGSFELSEISQRESCGCRCRVESDPSRLVFTFSPSKSFPGGPHTDDRKRNEGQVDPVKVLKGWRGLGCESWVLTG